MDKLDTPRTYGKRCLSKEASWTKWTKGNVVGLSDRKKSVTNLHAQIFERESFLLAPYAMKSANSLGRKYQETPHPYRGPFQRDRDRILHSSAFRRLSGKMQVFTGEMGTTIARD